MSLGRVDLVAELSSFATLLRQHVFPTHVMGHTPDLLLTPPSSSALNDNFSSE